MPRSVFLIACFVSLSAWAQAPSCPGEAAISIARGSLDPRPGVRYQLVNFHARLVPKAKLAPGCYEKITLVSRATVFISSDSLTRVFSQQLEASHSKVKNFAVQHDAQGATLTGSLTKVIPIHFAIRGPVSTDGSSIRLTVKSVKADGLPVKELLKLMGAELNSLFPVRGMKGIEIGEDFIAFSPEAIANLQGHIASVSTSDQGLTLKYAPAPHSPSTRRSSGD